MGREFDLSKNQLNTLVNYYNSSYFMNRILSIFTLTSYPFIQFYLVQQGFSEGGLQVRTILIFALLIFLVYFLSYQIEERYKLILSKNNDIGLLTLEDFGGFHAENTEFKDYTFFNKKHYSNFLTLIVSILLMIFFKSYLQV